MWGSNQQMGTARHASVTPKTSGGSLKRSLASTAAAVAVAAGGTVATAAVANAWQYHPPVVTSVCVDGQVALKGVYQSSEPAPNKDQPANWNDVFATFVTAFGNDGPKKALAKPNNNALDFIVGTGLTSIDAGTAKFTLKWVNQYRTGTDETSKVSYPAKSCGDEDTDKKISFCHATGSQNNPYVYLTTAREVFYQAGHVDHEGDIYPAGSFTKNGELVEWDAQGDQSLLDTNCMKPSPSPSGSPSPSPSTSESPSPSPSPSGSPSPSPSTSESPSPSPSTSESPSPSPSPSGSPSPSPSITPTTSSTVSPSPSSTGVATREGAGAGTDIVVASASKPMPSDTSALVWIMGSILTVLIAMFVGRLVWNHTGRDQVRRY